MGYGYVSFVGDLLGIVSFGIYVVNVVYVNNFDVVVDCFFDIFDFFHEFNVFDEFNVGGIVVVFYCVDGSVNCLAGVVVSK